MKLDERVAKLETYQEINATQMKLMNRKLDAINDAVNKRAAFMVGVTTAVTVIWSVVLGAVLWLKG